MRRMNGFAPGMALIVCKEKSVAWRYCCFNSGISRTTPAAPTNDSASISARSSGTANTIFLPVPSWSGVVLRLLVGISSFINMTSMMFCKVRAASGCASPANLMVMSPPRASGSDQGCTDVTAFAIPSPICVLKLSSLAPQAIPSSWTRQSTASRISITSSSAHQNIMHCVQRKAVTAHRPRPRDSKPPSLQRGA